MTEHIPSRTYVNGANTFTLYNHADNYAMANYYLYSHQQQQRIKQTSTQRNRVVICADRLAPHKHLADYNTFYDVAHAR